MTASSDNYRQIAKLFHTLNKRSALSNQESRRTHKSTWPNSSVFSLLNNIQNIHSRISKPSQTCFERKTIKHEKENIKTRMTTTISVVDFDRPFTCDSKPRDKRNELKRQCKSPSNILFNLVKRQKLALLQEEKQQVVQQIFNQQKAIIHRIDEDQENNKKPNAISFKTYFSLNKLMDLRDKINFTANYRPKTGGDRLKRIKQASPFL